MTILLFFGALSCVAAIVWTVYLRLSHPIDGQRFFKHPSSGKVVLHKAKWNFKGGVTSQDWWAEIKLTGHGSYRMVGLWTKGRRNDAIPEGAEWFYPYQLLTAEQVLELDRHHNAKCDRRRSSSGIRAETGHLAQR